jgi:hypothetical protein
LGGGERKMASLKVGNPSVNTRDDYKMYWGKNGMYGGKVNSY